MPDVPAATAVVIDPPPGLPANALVTWAASTLASIVTEVLNLSLISDGTAKEIVGIGGIALPLIFIIVDAIVRASHTQAVAKVQAARLGR